MTQPGFGVPFPDRIGPYRLTQVLGEGGMGIVYEAEETGPVRRRVAVKVIRSSMSSPAVIARFEAERQALAVMNHPGIARVFHAGTTDGGEPYFAMELVRGLPITQYCDANRLTINQRLDLFIDVCQAVQHAHQKGVIHRDLKPSNVLVTEQDGTPQPKIIDFGVAKALGQQLTDKTLVTLWGTAIGTAAFMSPEQADPSGLDVDTRSDIYSLGVLLYEILTGQLPIDPAELGVHGFLARLASRDTRPPVPSVRLSTAATAGAVAHARRTEVEHLQRDLRGDLDWIVMKAMDAERSRRYETANGLASDIRRHLRHEPVVARPPSTTYRVRKFVQRHRIGVATAGIVAAAVIGSAILATAGFVRATRAERRAANEAAAAQQVTDFLVELFGVSGPGQARATPLSARELLDRGVSRVSTELAGQPLLKGRILHTMGTVYQALGLYEQARKLLEEALGIRERELGPNDHLVAETLHALGDVARDRGEFDTAERYYDRALSVRRAAFGGEHVDVASTVSALAALRFRQGRSAEAESLYRDVAALDRRVRRPDDPRLARNLRGLGTTFWAQQRYAEAESLLKLTLDLQERTLGPEHADVAGTLNNLGGVYWSQKRYADALPLYERARPIFERTLDSMHSSVAGIHNNIGETYWKLGRFNEGEPLLRRALELKERGLAPGTPSIANTLNSLAGLLRDRGNYSEAESLYRRALLIREQLVNPAPLAETLRDYAEMLRRARRPAEAAALEQRAAAAVRPPPVTSQR